VARTFSTILSPNFRDLIVKTADCVFDPSAKIYVCSPVMSESLTVPVRTNVEKTSAGILTSLAPLSTVKSNVIAPFTCTGTTNVPPAFFNDTAFDGNPALGVGVSFDGAAVRVHTADTAGFKLSCARTVDGERADYKYCRLRCCRFCLSICLACRSGSC
jgi:hypothetical protein